MATGFPMALLGLVFSSRDASDTMERDMVRIISSFVILMSVQGKVGLGTGLVSWLCYRGADEISITDMGADTGVGQRSLVRYYQFVEFIIQIGRNFSIGQREFLPADP